ncbi:MAG: SPOR domain-containing protein [Saprospiraceae bacterium]|nr:SPOR domain-containing protein [Candidatus Brachybacter algidus]
MVELSEHLLDLVFRQKSAIIPDLGTFRFVTTSAKLNFGENVLAPPSQTLVFTESTFDQGDLTFLDFLVKEKGFDPYEANIRIKAYVHQIRNNFKQLGYSYIPGFGTLHLLENDTLKFVPGDKIKAIKPTLGLPDLTIKPIAREFVKNEIHETEVSINSFIDTRSEKVASQTNKSAQPALIAFFLFGISLIAYYLYTTSYGDNMDEKAVVAIPINEDSIKLATSGFVDSTIIEVKDSVSDKAAMVDEIDYDQSLNKVQEVPIVSEPVKEKKVEKTKQVPSIVKTTPVKTTTVKPDTSEEITSPSGKTCAVIVGAMANPDNAKKLARQVKSKGFTPFTFKTKNLTKVGAACNCDSESIESTLEAMKKINSSAWVYESE